MEGAIAVLVDDRLAGRGREFVDHVGARAGLGRVVVAARVLRPARARRGVALRRPAPEQVVFLERDEARVQHRQPARAERSEQAPLDGDGRPRVRHLERRAGAHEVVLHVDDEERGRRSRSAGGTSEATRGAGAASMAAILAAARCREKGCGRRVHSPPDADRRDEPRRAARRRGPGGAALAADAGGRGRPRGGRGRHHAARRRREDGADARAHGAPRRARPADPRRRPLQRPGGRGGARGARRRADPRRPARPRGDRAPAARPERDPDGRPQVRHERRAVAHVGDEHASSPCSSPRRWPRAGSWRSRPATSTRSSRPAPAGRGRTSRSCRRPATTPRAASGASACCAGTPRRAARRA